MTRISPTLTATKGMVCCTGCGHALTKTGTPWKAYANMVAVPLHTLPGASAGLHSTVTIRQFCCPSCHRLLDTETALPDDPFLNDIVMV